MSQSKRRKRSDASSAAFPVADIEDGCVIHPSEAVQLRTSLLAWYDANHRALPWRRNDQSKAPSAADPEHVALLRLPQQAFIYRVWISEIMCQQTQVARAAEYFSRWLKKWPDVSSLAAATLDEVNDLWAGLGYYRRARFLHSGAQHVVEQLGGKFPTTSKELQRIPGIGAYTGNAIASIACGEQVAVVDANVVRVVSRLLKIREDPTSKAAVARFAEEAQALLDPQRPGDFNQAMMELGAVICSGTPKCADCAIRTHCRAYADMQRHIAGGGAAADHPPVTQYPTKVQKAKRHEQTVGVCIVCAVDGSGGRAYLLVKRAEKGLLAGLWEFPSVQLAGDADAVTQKQRRAAVNDYLAGSLQLFPDKMMSRREAGRVSHTFSHIQMTLLVEVLTVQWAGGLPAPEAAAGRRWLTGGQLAREGLSSVMRKVATLIDKPQASAGQRKLSFGGAAKRSAPDV